MSVKTSESSDMNSQESQEDISFNKIKLYQLNSTITKLSNPKKKKKHKRKKKNRKLSKDKFIESFNNCGGGKKSD